MTGPLVAGSAVILTGRWLAVVRQAVLVAERSRRRNGLPASVDYARLLDAITEAASPVRQCDSHIPPEWQPSETPDELTIEEASHMLNKSTRTVQRWAPRLGGQLRAGRWMLDRRAVEEHIAGSDRG